MNYATRMTNYILEGGKNFNDQLMAMICCESDDDDDTELCPIDGQPLASDSISLACGHKFNYSALIEEVKRQKRHSTLETQSQGRFEVKCPYCRTIQKGVIPHRPSYPKISGVNWPPSRTYKGNRCGSLLSSGKRKGQVCGRACHEQRCTIHLKAMLKKTQFGTCVAVLKSGKRKGELCGCCCRGKHPTLCRRHSQNDKWLSQTEKVNKKESTITV